MSSGGRARAHRTSQHRRPAGRDVTICDVMYRAVIPGTYSGRSCTVYVQTGVSLAPGHRWKPSVRKVAHFLIFMILELLFCEIFDCKE